MSLMTLVIAVGGPLLGIAAVVALVVAHEHGAALRRSSLPGVARVPRAPHAGRRAATTLLDEYLSDEREAGLTLRRERHARLLIQTERSSTWVLDEYLEERGAIAVAPAPVPAAAPVRPAPVRVPAPAMRSAPRLQPRPLAERAA